MKKLLLILIALLIATPVQASFWKYYPEADTSTYAGDGSVSAIPTFPVSYAVINALTAGTTHSDSEASQIVENSVNSVSGFYNIRRLFFNYYTASVFPGNYVASSTAFFYGAGTENVKDGGVQVGLYENTQDDPTNLTDDDYNNLGTVLMSDALDLSPLAYEVSRPQSHTDDGALTTSETNAYDGNSATQSDTLTNADFTPSFRIYNIPDTAQTYTTLDLIVMYEAANGGGDDRYAIQYSTNNTDGTCNSASWTDIVAFTSANSSNNTTATTSLTASTDLSDICVRVNTDRVGGADSGHVYIEEVYTYGAYIDTASVEWDSAGYNGFLLTEEGEDFIAGSATTTNGVTSLGMRIVQDARATTPTSENQVNVYFADQTGKSNDPYILVNHYGLADMAMGFGF